MKYEILHTFPPPSLEPAWRGLMERLELPSHYTAPEYFLEPFWSGKQPFAVLAFEGDEAVAVLTGIHKGDEVICGLPTRPQVAVDPKADLNTALDALLQGLFHEARSAKLLTAYTWLSLEPRQFAAHGFRRRELQGCVVLDLSRGPEALFAEFSKNRRRGVRFAAAQGISVRIAKDDDDTRRAYDVYLQWHDTKRKNITEERRTFENFAAAHKLQDNRRLFLAELAGKIIAIDMFRFHSAGLIEYAGNSSLDEFLPLKPNDLLLWKAIEWACREGLRRFSLGGSDLFHRQFGGKVDPIVRYRVDRTLLRQHDLQEVVLDAARETFRKLPPSAQQRVRHLLGKKRP
jgi:Acetyltransferase (GNAT) domain